MSAWGRTGRVTLPPDIYGPDVAVDGVSVGFIDRGRAFYYDADMAPIEGPRLPSLDAAVLWVLRRVDPALWRQERGAWLVRKRKPGEGIVWRGVLQEWNEWWPWLVVNPEGVPVSASVDIPNAHKAAARLRAEAVSA